MKKVFELPLSRDYVRHWGMAEAVRELIQNALDSDSPFEYEFLGDSLFITSRHARLEPRSLLLGSTTKAERTDSIGSFGEGYKIALLVLTRLGYPCLVHNNELLWRPEFRRSRQYDSEVLCIVQEKAERRREGLTFEVAGLTPDDIAEIRESCLHMQNHLGETKQVPRGRILVERPGKLYVGGLFICETDLKYGYDVDPEFITLERDRQTVSSFDLKLLTRDMWFSTEDYDRVAELIEGETPDVEYAEFGAPELVKEACYRLFQRQHPGSVAAKSQEELEQLVDRGLTKTVVVNSTYHSCLTGSRSYQEAQGQLVRVPTPVEQLQGFFDRNRGLMRRKAIVEFKGLLHAAEQWRNK